MAPDVLLVETCPLAALSSCPVFYGPVVGDQRAGSFMAAHDDLQQLVGSDQRQLAHNQIVDE